MSKNYQLNNLNKEIAYLEAVIKLEILKNEKIKLNIQKKKLKLEKSQE